MSHLLIRTQIGVQRSVDGWGAFEVLSGANAGFGQFLISSNSLFLPCVPSPKMWRLLREPRWLQSVYVVLAGCDGRYLWAPQAPLSAAVTYWSCESSLVWGTGPLASPEKSPSPKVVCVITEQEAWSLPCGLIGLAFWKSPLLVKYINDSFRLVSHPGRALCKVPQIS